VVGVWGMVLLLALEVRAVADKTEALVLPAIHLQYLALLFKVTQAVPELTQARFMEQAVVVVQEGLGQTESQQQAAPVVLELSLLFLVRL